MEHHHPIKEIEELLNKLTRKELVMVNRAVLKRVKLMDDLERLKSNASFIRETGYLGQISRGICTPAE